MMALPPSTGKEPLDFESHLPANFCCVDCIFKIALAFVENTRLQTFVGPKHEHAPIRLPKHSQIKS
ncbi:hypothetical protein D3C87_1824980 [compost metagenome]